jgi:hypothetical protein
MSTSSCTISFFRNDLQKMRLEQGKCPIKNCSVDIQQQDVPFKHYKGRMIYLPFCPEHGLRIHKNTNTFVYYNGPMEKRENLIIATKRNLMFNSEYFVRNFLEKSNKVESHRLCYENSEDAVTYNVFTEILNSGHALKKLAKHITGEELVPDIELYLWGRKIDLKNNRLLKYSPLEQVQAELEPDIKKFKTEPDIMLIFSNKLLVCIEAKFGSKNPITQEKEEKVGEKPKSRAKLIERYCCKNMILDEGKQIFDFDNPPEVLYEQLFRNIVFAASMAKYAGIEQWYVVNLRSQHVMNVKRGEPESRPVLKNVRAILKRDYKKRFLELTWEKLYEICIRYNEGLHNLSWYMKNKTLGCDRGFNIF